MLIALTGKKGSGKDTIANAFAKRHGFRKRSLAAHIKIIDAIMASNDIMPDFDLNQVANLYTKVFGLAAANPEKAARMLIDTYNDPVLLTPGRDGKRRLALQKIGTELRRLDPEIHCKALVSSSSMAGFPIDCEDIIVPDVRLIDEVNFLRNRLTGQKFSDKFYLVRIKRNDLPNGTDDYEDSNLEEETRSHYTESEMEKLIVDFEVINLTGNINHAISIIEKEICNV